jgi:hypothetical protein
MSTRLKSNSKRNFGQSPLPTGYENDAGSPEFSIPSCGIEDVDSSMFNLFDKEICVEIGGNESSSAKKVPVIFAAGEKWALLRKGALLRDRNNTLILPLITIMRTELNQSVSEDVVGRGINQQLGEIVVKRRLDKSDRNYQNLINRLLIPNQKNVSNSSPDGISSDRSTGSLSSTKKTREGAFLSPNLKNNVYETLVVPMPQFYTAKYQITIWTQYTQHANQILEKVFSSFLPQGQSWRLDTPKGYWFIAKVEEGSFETETNFDDMSQQERYIKHSFIVTVPAYFFVSSAPGLPIPIKRYVSSPFVSFDTNAYPSISEETNESKYVLGSDDPTLPLDDQANNRDDQRNIGWRQQKVYAIGLSENPAIIENDPATAGIPRGYVKVKNTTSKGETVYSGASLEDLEIVVIK